MTPKSILTYFLSFIGYVIIQAALLNKFVIANLAFCFFYTGFLLFLPANTNRLAQMGIGFMIGFIIDLFGDTAGVHVISCVLMMYLRPYWSGISLGDLSNSSNFISIKEISLTGMLIYTLPLLFIHHLIVFLLDTIGVGVSYDSFLKALLSSILTFSVLYIIQLFLSPTKRK